MLVSAWPIWKLLHTVFGSIVEVGLLCVVGYMLARQGILDKRTQKHINRLNVSLFTPSLLFSKVAFFLTPEKLKELWTIPIVFVVTTICSMLVAYAFSVVMRLKKSQRSFAMAASMFMNSNSLPVALMQSMVYTVDALRWGDDDNQDAMLGRALTYLVLYSTLGMMLRWSYGVHLLSQVGGEDAHVPRHEETTPLIHPPTTVYRSDRQGGPTFIYTRSYDSISSSTTSYPDRLRPVDVDPTHLTPHGETHLRPKFFTSFPNTPMYSRSESLSDEELSDEDETAHTHTEHTCCAPAWRTIRAGAQRVHAFMTVPMWAALASVVVACTPPLQHALEVHVQPVKLALSSAGNCSIPLTLVVLGAYFYVPKGMGEGEGGDGDGHDEAEAEAEVEAAVRAMKARRSDTSLVQSVRQMFVLRRGRGVHVEDANGEANTGRVRVGAKTAVAVGETRTVVVAVLSRMVLTPLILLPLLTGFIASGANSMFDDPVFVLANVLLITSAPALTLAQITQAASGDAFERLISRTIFWAYCVVTPVSTIVSVMIGLLLTKL